MLNAAKNTVYIKQCFKQKLFRIKFHKKNLLATFFYFIQEWSSGFYLSFLKYYNTLEWESRFPLGLNVGKNTDYIKKSFKQKLFKIKFSIKNSVDAYLYLSQECSWRPPKIQHFRYFFESLHHTVSKMTNFRRLPLRS